MRLPMLLSWLWPALAVADAVPTFLPVPSQAVGAALNADGYRVESFGKGAYMVTDNQYQSLFFVSTKGVIVVDAPPTIGHGLLYAIGNITNAPVTHQIYSHSHADHIGASHLFGSNVTRIAHSLTREILSETPDPHRPLPDVVFSEHYDVQVGNQTIQLKYRGLNHHPGNIFIYSASQKVLMLVDIIFPGWVPYAYLAHAESYPGFIAAHDQILAYDFNHFVGGHLTRSGSRVDVENARAYVLDLKGNCERAFALGASPPNATNPISAQVIVPPVLAANPNNPFAVLRELLGTFAQYCANETNEKWQGKLAGTDVYGFEHAFQMVEFLRLDLDVLGPFGVRSS